MEDSRAVFFRCSGVMLAYSLSQSPNSSPLMASLAVLEGSGRSLHLSSSSSLAAQMDSFTKSSRWAASSLFVVKVPYRPSTKTFKESPLSRQCVTLSSSPFSVLNSSETLLATDALAFWAPYSIAFSRHLSANLISSAVSNNFSSIISFASHG